MTSFSMSLLVSLVAIASIVTCSSAGGVTVASVASFGEHILHPVEDTTNKLKESVANVVQALTQTKVHQLPRVTQVPIEVPEYLHEAIEKGAYIVGGFLAKNYVGPGGENGFRRGVRAKKLYDAGESLCEHILNKTSPMLFEDEEQRQRMKIWQPMKYQHHHRLYVSTPLLFDFDQIFECFDNFVKRLAKRMNSIAV